MLNSLYHKFGKRLIDVFFSLTGFLFLWPFFLLIAILIKLDSPGPIIFKQKRVGKGGKVFNFYKSRNMVKNAEKLKKKYSHLNEAKGPVFKIRNDPRYTRIGKFLSHTGLDELPQIFNILKGEMSLTGPRPLPVDEERKISKKWRQKRKQAKPGLTCSWLLKGAHRLSFKKWMKLDIEDIKKSGFLYDLNIFFKVLFMGFKLLLKEIGQKNHFPFSK